jgi:hypothetical protein
MVKRIEHKYIDEVECRKCGKCQTYKPLENFGFSKQTWDNLRPTCKDCLHLHNVENKDKITAYNKKYWQETKEVQTEKSKIWRENNKDRMKENMKKWLAKNAEYKKQKDAEYRINNWEKRKKSNAKWRREQYQKLQNDPSRQLEFANQKIKSNTSRRIREILGQKKSNSCMRYVGCDLDKFRIYLETKFQDGMSWSNYGENVDGGKTRAWHIDHKLPCSCFDMTNEIHVRACFYYKNLQPLWWQDNIQKKDQYDVKERDNYIRWFIDMFVL